MSTKVNTLIYSKFEQHRTQFSFFFTHSRRKQSEKMRKNVERLRGMGEGVIAAALRKNSVACKFCVVEFYSLGCVHCSQNLCIYANANGCFCHLYEIKLHNSITRTTRETHSRSLDSILPSIVYLPSCARCCCCSVCLCLWIKDRIKKVIHLHCVCVCACVWCAHSCRRHKKQMCRTHFDTEIYVV